MTLLERLNKIPPKRCRSVARIDRRPASHEQIAGLCGWSREKVIRVSKLSEWDNLTMADCETFARACGLRLEHLRRDFYLKFRRMKSVLRHLTHSQRRMYAELFA